MANAAENSFADRAILLDENLLLFEQNNKKNHSCFNQRYYSRQCESLEL
jgi:hypothetical protein